MDMIKSGYRRGSFLHSPMHFGFISMEPNSLFIPQYLDSDLVLFIHQREARNGHIYRDELVERRLKHGDVYTIPSGSAFYLENRVENQRLHIICSISITSESMGWSAFQSFFIGGGIHPASVLSGLDHTTLSTALNKNVVKRVNHRAPSTYNLYNRNPNCKNNCGWSKKLDESDYSALQQSDNGIYPVNLSPGSMMAPHVNPKAIAYGVVLKGAGWIQIVYPNGTLAMKTRVREGDVFWCQGTSHSAKLLQLMAHLSSLASLHHQGGTFHNS